MTTPLRWKEIDGIFAAALERDTAERPAFLAEVCGADAQLRKEVESLIAHIVPESLVEGQAPRRRLRLLANGPTNPLLNQSDVTKLLDHSAWEEWVTSISVWMSN